MSTSIIAADGCGLMRNRYLDLLRALAIVRVVVYHTTGWAFLTLAFPAMSVMFAIAGSLMAASLTRSGPAAVGRRLRRLLPSLWLLAACFVPAMLLTSLPVSWRLLLWVVPLADPPTNAWGALALSAIWYLRDCLWFILVSPVAWWLFRRYPLPTLLAPYALLIVVEFGFLTAPLVLRDFGLSGRRPASSRRPRSDTRGPHRCCLSRPRRRWRAAAACRRTSHCRCDRGATSTYSGYGSGTARPGRRRSARTPW